MKHTHTHRVIKLGSDHGRVSGTSFYLRIKLVNLGTVNLGTLLCVLPKS